MRTYYTLYYSLPRRHSPLTEAASTQTTVRPASISSWRRVVNTLGADSDALIKRLREVRDRRPATESELRTLKEQAEGWARAVSGQISSSERRIRRLTANPASSLAQIASECFMPVAYGGGIRDLDDIKTIFSLGIEKVGVNSYGWEAPSFVQEASDQQVVGDRIDV